MSFLDPVKKELAEVESEILQIASASPKEVYGILPPFFKRGGKRIRPALVLLSAGLAGLSPKTAIKPAALVEIFHNFTLIHDDIEDNSLMRRGEPTLNNAYGIPIALNSGDALYTLLWDALNELKLPPEKLIKVQKMMVKSFRRVVEGQGLELHWHKNNLFNLTEKNYFEMVGGKTGALIGLSCELGGFLADSDSTLLSNLRSFGEKIGVAFQISDDVLNIEGDVEKYKKEICGDITEGKRSLMVINTLEQATAQERSELCKILDAHTTKKEDFEFVSGLFRKYGSIEYAKSVSSTLVQEAKALLKKMPDSKYRSALDDLANFVVSRES